MACTHMACTHMHTYMHTHACMHTYMHTHAYAHARIRTHTQHTYMHIACTHIHAHAQALPRLKEIKTRCAPVQDWLIDNALPV